MTPGSASNGWRHGCPYDTNGDGDCGKPGCPYCGDGARECPFCGLHTRSTREEIEHMDTYHPDVIHDRLLAAGMTYGLRKGFRSARR